jgi:hypothetical protein
MKNRFTKIRFIREIYDFYRLFWGTSNIDKDIVFFSEHRGYYPYFAGLIEELVDNNNKSICYVTSDYYDPILNNSESRIKAFYLRTLLPFFMIYVSCKVFVITLTDLNRFYLKRSVNPVHYIYVFHSLISTHMGYLSGAFDHYDSILCAGPHHVTEIQNYEKLKGLSHKKLIEVGYQRIEAIFKEYQAYKLEISFQSPDKTILIAPSWGKDNILETCGEALVQILLNAGYSVIVRPHPETAKRNPKLLSALNSQFSPNSKFTLELTVATNNSLLKADLLISDASGIVMEYAFGTERPVLFLNVPVKIRNPGYEDLRLPVLELEIRSKIGKIIDTSNIVDLPHIISYMIQNTSEYKEQILALRKLFLFNFGDSAKIGAEYILNKL